MARPPPIGAALLAAVLLLHVVGVLAARPDEWPLSSHSCVEGPSGSAAHRVCYLSNVFIYEGRVHYLASECRCRAEMPAGAPPRGCPCLSPATAPAATAGCR